MGAVPDVGSERLRTLGLVALALFFDQYDFGLLTSALPYIAAELGMAESDLGAKLSLVRLGALPAFLLLPLADRFGRRRAFLISIAALSIGTALTAFARTPDTFVALQMTTRIFMTAAMSLAFVIITEEFPAEHRGWGLGMLGALGACGIGLGAGLFGAIDLLPGRWRALYAIGIVPVLLLPFFARGLRETHRFERHRESVTGRGTSAAVLWLRQFGGFVRAHPGRVLAVSTASFLGAVGSVSVFQFTSVFVRQVHGWKPWEFAVMTVVGGAFGIVGNIVAGRLGDRFGRRRIGALAGVCFPVFATLFYQSPGSVLPLAWVGFVFCVGAKATMLRAFATELFPTALRGSAMGLAEVLGTLGAATGLFLFGLGTQQSGNLADMASLLSISVAVAGVAMLALPETRGRELEALHPEDSVAS